nr:MmpS family transport accessory protein [Plantibacter sp. Leaf314]
MTYTAGFAGLVSDAVKTAKAESSAAANKEISVIYEVNGTATDASITYSTYSAGSSSTEQASGKSLPFIQELTVQAGSEYDYASYSLQAQNGAEDTGSVSCKITVDGDVVAEQTATGAYAMGHAPRRVPTGCRRTSRRLLPSSLERACFDGRHREALDLTSWRIRTATRSLASAEAG